MAKPLIVGISGNLATPSRTLSLVASMVDRISYEAGGRSRILDVSDLFGLGETRSRAGAAPAVEAALKVVESADFLVVGSPVYKGSYTGLFKHFIDLIDYRALVGTPVALLATGGSDRHALVVEHQLRPLFAFFQARVMATGVFISERDISDGIISDVGLRDRLDQLVQESVDALRQPSRKNLGTIVAA